MLVLFPVLEVNAKILLLFTVQGFISVSHNTMGYRRWPYLAYILLLALPTIYAAYHAEFTYPLAIAMLLVVHLAFVLRTANAFYTGYTAMLFLQEESIGREHRLLMQREQASLANQAKTEFLSRMSHELRTPLNAVLGLNELQMLDKDNPLSQQQRLRAEKINEAGQHLLSLVNDVLDLSRIEAGSLKVKLEPLDLQQTIREACKLVETRAADQDIDLAFEALPEPAWVRADGRRLRQVLVNLLDNAVKYNRAGGNVTVSLTRRGQCWRVSVIDTGYGIAQQDMPQLFKPFARLRQSRHRVDGVGIGLSFSQQLVEIMQGEMGVDSRVGEGSCFWVEIPQAEPQLETARSNGQPAANLQAARPAGSMPERGNRLLLVEDNLVNQEVAKEMLVGMGFEVDVAENGEQALERSCSESYAAILMDCEMPVMDGFSATRKLREYEQQQRLPPTPVIALTAHAIFGAREKCLASGMDDFLSKPFNSEDLMGVLSRWLALPQQATADTPAAASSAAAPEAETGRAADPGVLDQDAINRLRTRKASLVDRVIELYLEQSPQVLDEIDVAAAAQDFEHLANIVHTFKSSSLTVGAVEVAEICRQIEAACQRNEATTADADRIRERYRVAHQALQEVLQASRLSA